MSDWSVDLTVVVNVYSASSKFESEGSTALSKPPGTSVVVWLAAPPGDLDGESVCATCVLDRGRAAC